MARSVVASAGAAGGSRSGLCIAHLDGEMASALKVRTAPGETPSGTSRRTLTPLGVVACSMSPGITPSGTVISNSSSSPSGAGGRPTGAVCAATLSAASSSAARALDASRSHSGDGPSSGVRGVGAAEEGVFRASSISTFTWGVAKSTGASTAFSAAAFSAASFSAAALAAASFLAASSSAASFSATAFSDAVDFSAAAFLAANAPFSAMYWSALVYSSTPRSSSLLRLSESMSWNSSKFIRLARQSIFSSMRSIARSSRCIPNVRSRSPCVMYPSWSESIM